jgi:C4-dicarboxylate-specific signal transduction histidine kinase
MASERRSQVIAAAAGVGMLGCAFCAGALLSFPRLAVLCGLAAVPQLVVCVRSIRAASSRRAPFVQAGGALSFDQQSLLDNALALEARLEHTPVALFWVDGAHGEGAVSPLNANARKLVAPGRAVDLAGLYRELQAQPVSRRGMIGFETERGSERALAAVSALSLHGKQQRLAALMPVESELEAEALNAWRELVHVLTHEIMNSLTPVASLSRTARDLLDEFRASLPGDVGADLAIALDAINRRADSLAGFVGSYRSLSNLPEARPERIRLTVLFERVAVLVGPAWRERGGRANFIVEPESLELVVDAGQLEQALINLLKNAADATGQLRSPEVSVTARLARGSRLRIEVADNGPGVPDELTTHIFTPFFTTKKQGGGIGLAMVRQLVHGNGGTVRYARSVGAGARFVITF